MFLGLGGGYGSKNPSLQEKRGAISFMVFAGLFFAFGIMPIKREALEGWVSVNLQ